MKDYYYIGLYFELLSWSDNYWMELLTVKLKLFITGDERYAIFKVIWLFVRPTGREERRLHLLALLQSSYYFPLLLLDPEIAYNFTTVPDIDNNSSRQWDSDQQKPRDLRMGQNSLFLLAKEHLSTLT